MSLSICLKRITIKNPAQISPVPKKNIELKSFNVLERDSRVEKNHAPLVPRAKEIMAKIIKMEVFSFIRTRIELLLNLKLASN